MKHQSLTLTLLVTLGLLMAGCAETDPASSNDPNAGDGTTTGTPPTAGGDATPTPTSPTTEPAPEPTPQPTLEPTPEPTPAPPDPITFSGTGKKVTEEFTTEKHLVRVEMTHDGSSNFAIWVMDATTGQNKELAVNEIGSYDGAHYFSLAPGTYVLDVSADGAWTTTIEQPMPTEGRSTPTTYEGTGDTAPEPVRLESGLRRFDMNHDGSSNFAVWLIDSKGQKVDLLANEIGSWEGEKAVGIPREGLYFLDVTADGTWSIAIR